MLLSRSSRTRQAPPVWPRYTERGGFGRMRQVIRPLGRCLAIAIVAVLAVVSLTSCGRSPNSPDPGSYDPLFVRPGLQRVSITGFGISSDPAYPPCTPLGVPIAGTQIITTMTVSKEGSDWVLRSVSPEQGNAVIRFHSTGAFEALRPVFAGTATGFQVYTGFNTQRPEALRLFIDGTAIVDGSTAAGFFALGRMTGVFRFVDDQGNTGSCAAVAWDFQPAQ